MGHQSSKIKRGTNDDTTKEKAAETNPSKSLSAHTTNKQKATNNNAIESSRISNPSANPIPSQLAANLNPSAANNQNLVANAQKVVVQAKCPICLEFLNNLEIRSIQCKHTFCSKCINHCLQYFPVCPVCRSIIENSGFSKHEDFINRCNTGKFSN